MQASEYSSYNSEPSNQSNSPNAPTNYMQYGSIQSYYDDPKTMLYSTADYKNTKIIDHPIDDQSNTQSNTQPNTHLKPSQYIASTEPIPPLINQQSTPITPKFNNNNPYYCPMCNEMAINTCGCSNRDSICSQGHKWYINNNRKELGISNNH